MTPLEAEYEVGVPEILAVERARSMSRDVKAERAGGFERFA